MKVFRKMITGANWKIYKKTCSEVREFIRKLKNNIDKLRTDLIDAYILPDPVCLQSLIDELGDYPISYGTQDIFWEDSGSYTGEISPLVLKDLGCRYVFIGHSERKKYFGETDSIINKKILACYRNNIYPILLIGESMDQRQKNITLDVLKKQLQTGLDGIPPEFLSKMALVYEPVWAIGQKDSASLKIIEESHLMVRELLSSLYNPYISQSTRILYGGSVNIKNGVEIIKIPDVDGLAITRGALDPDNFSEFIKMTETEAEKRYQ
jgi:triosephosphate isomerase (TIM)